jgi:molybdenum cofactor cytidylyltransferase
VLQRVIATLQAAGIERILVVTGPHIAEVGTQAEACGATAFVLPTPTAAMRATVEAGLRWVQEHWQPTKNDAWLLLPADHPCLAVDVIQSLLAARQAHPKCTIFVPTQVGRRGHPVLIGWNHVAAIRSFPPHQGLNAYLRTQAEATLEVPVQSESVLWDLDTPADYERLRSVIAQGGS